MTIRLQHTKELSMSQKDQHVVATFDAIDILERLRQSVDPRMFRAESTLYRAALHLADSIRSCTSFGQS